MCHGSAVVFAGILAFLSMERAVMRVLLAALGVVVVALVALPARAEVSVASVFGSGMVLQREMAVPVWGWAAPGEEVAVAFAGQKHTTKAGGDGRWRVALSAMPADATPRPMTVAGAGNTLTLDNVLVGEVWLCSGQSNMVWELRSCLNATEEIAAANFPNIRCFTAGYAPGMDGDYKIDPSIEAKRYALRPRDKCLGSWKPCTPANAGGISGVAYFFARRIHQELGVPVGVVVSAVGATDIVAWMSLDALKEVPIYRERAEAFELLAKDYLADPSNLPKALEAEQTRIAQRQTKWFAKLDAEDPGLLGGWMKNVADADAWSPVTLPVTVEDNPLGAPVASIWFRKEVAIPREWVGKDLDLRLGVIDAVDETYVNGTRVGRTWFDTKSYWGVSRVYDVPAAATSTTKLNVTLRLLKTKFHMAPLGPAAEMRVAPKGDDKAAPVSLAGEWRMRKAQGLEPGLEPQPAPTLNLPPGNHYGHPAAQYNGLIRPIAGYAIRGALWYQGEANVPFYLDYRELMPGLITSWRREWGQGDFHFGVVQLADYQAQQTTPVERIGYQNVREAQATALKLPNTFLATAVGAGEGRNIHPRNKQEVGRRLALGALGTAYGKKETLHSGPVYKSMKIEGDKVRLAFDFAKGLHAQGEPPVGFVIAGADRAFHFADARIEGESVVVWSEKVPRPVAVRYAWANNPVCNVYNGENLPVFQFATDSWDLSQLVIVKEPPILPAGWTPK